MQTFSVWLEQKCVELYFCRQGKTRKQLITPTVATLGIDRTRHSWRMFLPSAGFIRHVVFILTQFTNPCGDYVQRAVCWQKKKKKLFSFIFERNEFCNLFAGFWWDLVVWLKMGRDRQRVSDPDIKQWDVEGLEGRPGGTSHRDAGSHARTYTPRMHTRTHARLCSQTHAFKYTYVRTHSPQGSNRDRQEQYKSKVLCKTCFHGPTQQSSPST